MPRRPILTRRQSPVGDQQATALGTIARGAGGKYTLREDAYEVRLNASVFDQAGKSIQTLDKDAFHVYEDGVPQTIASFRHEDLPVSLGILIDSSGSMYDKRAAVDQASLDLVKLSNPEDEAFLVDFSWEAFIDQDFTSDISKLQQGLGYIKSSGGTAIYDALVASADYLSKNAKHPKQVLLVVTDGEDNASSATLEQAIRRIQDLDGPVIYCVGLLFGDDTRQERVAPCPPRAGDALRADRRGGLLSQSRSRKSTPSRRKSPTTSARSTPSPTTRPSRPLSAATARCMSRPRPRATASCPSAPAAATTRASPSLATPIPISKRRPAYRAHRKCLTAAFPSHNFSKAPIQSIRALWAPSCILRRPQRCCEPYRSEPCLSSALRSAR